MKTVLVLMFAVLLLDPTHGLICKLCIQDPETQECKVKEDDGTYFDCGEGVRSCYKEEREILIGNTVIEKQVFRKCGAESTFKFDGCIVLNLTKEMPEGEDMVPEFPGLMPGGLDMMGSKEMMVDPDVQYIQEMCYCSGESCNGAESGNKSFWSGWNLVLIILFTMF